MDTFYKDLPSSSSLREIFENDFYRTVPDTWHVVITDVKNSTAAIEAGRYKDVNVAGGLAAMAISNAFRDFDFPFVFGGDGVTFLIPGENEPVIRDILFDTIQHVRDLFQLDLRAGIVPVRTLYERGHDLQAAKLRISEYYNQAIIRGSGADYAETLVKDPVQGTTYLINAKSNPNIQADFSGFTCRWQDIRSTRGETISLIVKLRGDDKQARDRLYLEILDRIQKIYGTEASHHPLREETLVVARDESYLGREARAAVKKAAGLAYRLRLWKIKFETWASGLIMKYNLKIESQGLKINELKKYQMLSCDFKKYDGTLKMVIQGEAAHRQQLNAYLDELKQRGLIYYGIHASDRALMTCLMQTAGATGLNTHREVHFVDSADGGYALAAKQLKAQMKAA